MKNKNNNISLYIADDVDKDQSYFMFQTKKEDMPFLKFPLGNLKKNSQDN